MESFNKARDPTRYTSYELKLSLTTNVAECIDIFTEAPPQYTLNYEEYLHAAVARRLDMETNSLAISKSLMEGDLLMLKEGGCANHNLPLIYANLHFDSSLNRYGVIGQIVSRNLYSGHHYELCLQSQILPNEDPIKLTQIYIGTIYTIYTILQYIVQNVIGVNPHFGSSYIGQNTPLIFTLYGGDQSEDDYIQLRKIGKNVHEYLNSTLYLHENEEVYNLVSYKQENGIYSALNPIQMYNIYIYIYYIIERKAAT